MFIVLAGLLVKAPVNTEMPAYEPIAGGLSV